MMKRPVSLTTHYRSRQHKKVSGVTSLFGYGSKYVLAAKIAAFFREKQSTRVVAE